MEKMKKTFLKFCAGVLLGAALLAGCSAGKSGQRAEGSGAASGGSEWTDAQKDVPDISENASDYKVKSVPMSEEEQRETAQKLMAMAKICQPVYSKADKGGGLNVVLEETAVHEMADAAAAQGFAVTCKGHDYNMRNYEEVHENLEKARAGEDAETEIYVVDADGIFRYYGFQWEGKELTITSAGAAIEEAKGTVIQQMEKIQPYAWEYTSKGWLIWEKALSRNHEMDMHVFFRILPLDERCRELTNKCIAPVGYVKNNLFLTDWDSENMQEIVFNDLFDSLYAMEKGIAPKADDYPEGIPKEEFESLMLSYFDMTAERLEEYGSYDREKGVYPWNAAGPRNRMQRTRPFPEAVQCVDNGDGVISLHVEAIFMEIGKDCAFSHIVTMREEDGKWIYLGNKIDWENSYTIPSYKARKDYAPYPF